jgi:hypothetical protein
MALVDVEGVFYAIILVGGTRQATAATKWAPIPACSGIGLDDGAQACLRIIIRAINSVGNSHCEVSRRLELTPTKISNWASSSATSALSLWASLKNFSLEISRDRGSVRLSFLRPGQHLDADIVPSDSEVKRLLSLNRSNLGEDLAYCSQ